MHPQAIYRDPEQLAKDAQVDLDIVQRSVRRAQIIAPIADLAPSKQISVPLPNLRFIGHALMAFMRDPAIVVGVTLGLFLLATMVFPNSGSISNLSGVYRYAINVAIPTIVLIIGMILQAICYFLHGQAMKSVRGSITFFLIATVAGLTATAINPPEEGLTVESLLVPVVGFGFLGLFYAAIAIMLSVAGGYLRMRLQKADRNRMDRQELLEQMFDIQERLQESPEDVVQRHSWHAHPIAQEIESKLFQWSALLGFGATAITVLVAGAITARFRFGENSLQYLLVVGALGLFSMALQFAVSFLGRTIGRALLVALIFAVSSLIGMLLPFGGFGYERLDAAMILGNLGWALGVGLVAGVGAAIEYRANVEYLIRSNDPETLLVEYMDLQRRLNPGPREMTVLVVDAAKSSLMKSSSDPFVAEWSFRAYQQFLERLADEHAGEVLSTAGDGAVMAFHDASQATQCSFAIQSKVKDFNEKTNKLEMPFSLRIGLHRGMVAGQIDKVEFTDVIDIAAHVEAACKVGGVAVSERIWSAVDGLRGEPIAIQIDGFTVYQLELT